MDKPTRDFDHWLKLAQTSPEGLESARKAEIDALIEAAPEHLRPRLRGLQFRIDCCRRLHQSPLGACISISDMMRDCVEQLSTALQGSLPRQSTEPAKVIPFPSQSQGR